MEIRGDGSVYASGKKPDKDEYTLTFTNLTGTLVGLRIEALADDALPSIGPGRADTGNFVLTEVVANLKTADGKSTPVRFKQARASFEQTQFVEQNPYKLWSAASTIACAAR